MPSRTATGTLKGIAVVPHDIRSIDLERLKDAGVIGVAFNATFHGVDYYRETSDLLARLSALDMCVSLQVERDQLVAFAPAIERSGIRWLIDWPFLRATERIDCGPLLALVERFIPNADDRRKVLWQTPCRVLDFAP